MADGFAPPFATSSITGERSFLVQGDGHKIRVSAKLFGRLLARHWAVPFGAKEWMIPEHHFLRAATYIFTHQTHKGIRICHGEC